MIFCFFLQSHYQWQYGHPVSYQYWKSTTLKPITIFVKDYNTEWLNLGNKYGTGPVKNCIFANLVNLGNPEWIPINCESELPSVTIFDVTKVIQLRDAVSTTIHQNSTICEPNQFFIHGKCYIFVWYNSKLSKKSICNEHNSKMV